MSNACKFCGCTEPHATVEEMFSCGSSNLDPAPYTERCFRLFVARRLSDLEAKLSKLLAIASPDESKDLQPPAAP